MQLNKNEGVPRHGRGALFAQTFLPGKKVTASIANAEWYSFLQA
jgi:hypothetical protein